jgi:hypothetical protein
MNPVTSSPTPAKTPGTKPEVKAVVLTEINYQQVLEMAPEDQEKLMKGFHRATARSSQKSSSLCCPFSEEFSLLSV